MCQSVTELYCHHGCYLAFTVTLTAGNQGDSGTETLGHKCLSKVRMNLPWVSCHPRGHSVTAAKGVFEVPHPTLVGLWKHGLNLITDDLTRVAGGSEQLPFLPAAEFLLSKVP